MVNSIFNDASNCLSALAAGSEMGAEQVELVCEEVAIALTSVAPEIIEALLQSRRRRKAERTVGFIWEAAEQINRISFVIV